MTHPDPIKDYTALSYPIDMEEIIMGSTFPEVDIQEVMKIKDGVSYNSAIYALKQCKGDVAKAKMICLHKDYHLKFALPEEGVYSIGGVQTMDECNIFSVTGRPYVISNRAVEHYKVTTIEDLIGKQVGIFRRWKLPSGKYQTPYKYYIQKGILKKLDCTHTMFMASAIVEYEDGGLSRPLSIDRIVIV